MSVNRCSTDTFGPYDDVARQVTREQVGLLQPACMLIIQLGRAVLLAGPASAIAPK